MKIRFKRLTLKQWIKYAVYQFRKSIFNWILFKNSNLIVAFLIIEFVLNDREKEFLEKICVDYIIRGKKTRIP